MGTAYQYDRADFTTSSGAANLDRLTNEVRDSAIVKTLEHISGDAEYVTFLFAETLSGAEEDVLDAIVADHTGEPPDWQPTEFDYWRQNPIVTDSVTGKSAEFAIMQALINRREIFNDADNPVYKPGHVPLIGPGGSVTNLNDIHGKLGWHGQQVTQALYPRPADLLVYYGWLNSFNSGVHGWDNEKVAQELARYRLLVLGNGLADPSHGDYANTAVIIPRVLALNPSCRIFGYVSVNQDLSTFQTKVNQWNALGVAGIFLDEAGYDYGLTRAEFNERVDYVHERSAAKLAFANAWNTDHVLGTADDASYPNATYNATLAASHLMADDWVLLESCPINTTAYTGSTPVGYESKYDWAARCVKAQGLRATYGINVAACGIVNDDNAGGQALFDFGYTAACAFAWDAFGISDTSYGSGSAKGRWWTRPDVSKMGAIYSVSASVQLDAGDADVYVRYAQGGRFRLDFSDGAQASAIDKW